MQIPKNSLKFIEIFDDPTYSALLHLLDIGLENEKFKGFEEKHFQYLLLKNPNLKEKTIKEMKIYFKNEPYFLIFKGILKKQDDIDYRLQNLVLWGYVKTKKKKNRHQYFLVENKYILDFRKFVVVKYLEESRNCIPKGKENDYEIFRFTKDKKGSSTTIDVKIPNPPKPRIAIRRIRSKNKRYYNKIVKEIRRKAI